MKHCCSSIFFSITGSGRAIFCRAKSCKGGDSCLGSSSLNGSCSSLSFWSLIRISGFFFFFFSSPMAFSASLSQHFYPAFTSRSGLSKVVLVYLSALSCFSTVAVLLAFEDEALFRFVGRFGSLSSATSVPYGSVLTFPRTM